MASNILSQEFQFDPIINIDSKGFAISLLLYPGGQLFAHEEIGSAAMHSVGILRDVLLTCTQLRRQPTLPIATSNNKSHICIEINPEECCDKESICPLKHPELRPAGHWLPFELAEDI